MKSQHQMVFVRRGAVVKGPVPLAQVAAFVKAGKVLPSDEVAEADSGPWAPVYQVLGKTRIDLPVIEVFTLKKSLLFAGWLAAFQCPKCGESLQCAEKEMSKRDACPHCRQPFRLSARVIEEVRLAKDAQEQQRLTTLASAREQRDRRARSGYDAAVMLAGATGRGLKASGDVVRRLIVISLVVGGIGGIIALAEKAFTSYRNNTPEATFDRFVGERKQDLFAMQPLRPIRSLERDLRKSDSLTTPYTGTITFSTVWQLRSGEIGRRAEEGGNYVLEGDATCEVHCARDAQRQQWSVKNATVTTTNWRVLRSDDSGIGEKVADGMNREGVPPETLNEWGRVLSALQLSNKTFRPQALNELLESEASYLGRSHVAELRFEKLEHVEPSVIDELVKAREVLVAAAHGKNVSTSDKKWPFVPRFGYGFLILDRIPVVSDALARSVAGFRGTVSLAGITSLSDAAADQLASHVGCLQLPKLQRLSQKAMVTLASRSGDLEIGVARLPDEVFEMLARDESPESRLDPEERKHVALVGLTDISEAGIAAVVQSSVRFSMRGLKTLTSVPLAKKLMADTHVKTVNGESLKLDCVESLSDEVADVVAGFQGNIDTWSLRKLKKLTSVGLAKRLVADAGGDSQRLFLNENEIQILSVAAAGVLAEFSGPITIGPLSIKSTDEEFDLTPDVAAALARHLGELQINVGSLTSEAAAALVGHEGRLEIHSREEVSRSVRDLLKTHKGKVEVTQRNPIFKTYEGGDGTPVISDQE